MPWHLLLQAAPGGNLDLPIEQFAHTLRLPPFIFRARHKQGVAVGGQCGQPTPSLGQLDLPQMPPIVYGQPAFVPRPEPEPAWPSNLPIGQAVSQGMANAGNVSDMGGLFPTDLAAALSVEQPWSPQQLLVRDPSFGDSQFVQQQQSSPDMRDHSRHGFQGQHQVAQVVDSLRSAAANSPLPRLPFTDSQERSSRTGSLSSEDVRYNPGHMPLSPSDSAPLPTYPGQGQVSPASGQSVTGCGQPIEGSAQGSALMCMPQDQGQLTQGFEQAPQGQGQLQPSQMQAFTDQMPAASRSRSEALPSRSVGSARKAKLRHIQSDKPERLPRRESSIKDRRGNVCTLSFCFDWLSLYIRSVHTAFSLSSVNKTKS